MTTFACDLSTFTAEDREQHQTLTSDLSKAVTEVKEIEDGYAFKVGEAQEDFERAASWVVLENRCCPFLRFHIEWELDRPVWLHVKGPDGVKSFIRDELKLR